MFALRAFAGAAVVAMAANFAHAADFRSTGENPAVLYDAPSAKAKKLFVIGGGYPLEVVVKLEGWTKVRDAAGVLSWIENSNLTERRTVLVKEPLADVRQAAEDRAPLVFQAERDVLLELVEVTGTGWARVNHRDGQSGFVKLTQIWGV
jgi:SH3-like domain-containing protein